MVGNGLGTNTETRFGETADESEDFPWLDSACEPLLLLCEMGNASGRIEQHVADRGPGAAAAAASPSPFAERTIQAVSSIDLGSEIIVKIGRGDVAARLYRTESCLVKGCNKVILPSPHATPLLMICAGHHEIERPLRIFGADYSPLLRGLAQQVFDLLKTKNPVWQAPVSMFPAPQGLFDTILFVLGLNRNHVRVDRSNATFVKHSFEIYDLDRISMLLAFQRFDNSRVHCGNGLIKRSFQTDTVQMVIAPLTVHLETRRSDRTATLILRVCSSIRTRPAPNETWVLSPAFHIPLPHIGMQHDFCRSISALYGAMDLRQRGQIASDKDYTVLVDKHAHWAEACVRMQVILAAEHKEVTAAARRASIAKRNEDAGAAAPVRRARARALLAAAAAVQGDNPSQARDRRLAELCRVSGARRETFLEGSETRQVLADRIAARVQYLTGQEQDLDDDIPLLFFQQQLENLEAEAMEL